MHRCLQIPDIALAICQESNLKSTLSIALTCRSLTEPALDRLWNCVTSLGPLLSCLPLEIWKIELVEVERQTKSTAVLRAPLKQEHLKRYTTFYAHRIRVARLNQCNSILPSVQLLQALQLATNYQHGALAPLLRTYEWPSGYHGLDEFAPSLSSLFLGDHVTMLGIRSFSGEILSMASLDLHTKRLPRLKHLNMRSSEEDMLPYLLSQPWSHLASAVLGWARTESLEHLARLPQLQSLELNTMMNGADVTQALDPNQNFRSLRRLILTVDDLKSLQPLLSWVPPSSQIEELSCTGLWGSSASEYQKLIGTIAHRCSPLSLSSVYVFSDPSRFLSGSLRISEELVDTGSSKEIDISALYKFNALQSLIIHYDRFIRTTPQDATLISTSWPLLHHLDICPSSPSHGRTPNIQLTDVLTILRGCPALRFLGIRFDATHITGQEDPPPLPFRLKTFFVGESPICSPSSVADFFKTHLPYLETLDANYVLPSSVSRPTMLDKRWAAVVDSLGLTPTRSIFADSNL